MAALLEDVLWYGESDLVGDVAAAALLDALRAHHPTLDKGNVAQHLRGQGETGGGGLDGLPRGSEGLQGGVKELRGRE